LLIQHFFNFFPLPQGQRSFLPIFFTTQILSQKELFTCSAIHCEHKGARTRLLRGIFANIHKHVHVTTAEPDPSGGTERNIGGLRLVRDRMPVGDAAVKEGRCFRIGWPGQTTAVESSHSDMVAMLPEYPFLEGLGEFEVPALACIATRGEGHKARLELRIFRGLKQAGVAKLGNQSLS
jgi:hypothetical protein